MNKKNSFTFIMSVLFFIVFLFAPLQSFSQEKAVKLDGVWEGTLDAGGMQLRIVVNISLMEDGSYKLQWTALIRMLLALLWMKLPLRTGN